MHLAVWRDGSDGRQQPIHGTALYVLGDDENAANKGGIRRGVYAGFPQR
jgi:hypothetical protein